MNNPVRHHYIPQFYLKRWLNSEGILYVYMRGRKEPIELHEKGLINFCQENHLYSIPSIAPNDPAKIEKEWAVPIDTQAAGVIDKFDNGKVENLTDAERLSWANFCATLWYRSPKGLKYISQKTVKNPISCFLSDVRKQDLPAYTLPKLNYLESENIFTGLNWFVSTTEDELLIGDTLPTFNMDVDSQWYVYLPICPNKIFYVAINNPPPFNDKNRQEFNKWIVQNAERFVFANSRKNKEFILKYFK